MSDSPLRKVEVPAGPRPDRPEYVSDLVVDELRRLGCRYIALTPGSSFRGLHDSLVNYGGNDDVKMILCAHEEVAVALAHGYAKATGEVAVAVLHDLVGLMHATMAIYNAWADRAPLLLLGGGGPAEPSARRPIDWLHSAHTQADLVRRYVKWDAEPVTADALLDDIRRAYRAAAAAPSGPTYVTLDFELQERSLAGQPPAATSRPYPPGPEVSADPAAIDRAADLLTSASFPLLVAGRTGLVPAATALVAGLAEDLGAACHDETSFVTLPTDHPLNLTGDGEVYGDADALLAIDAQDLRAVLAKGAPRQDRRVVDLSVAELRGGSWANIDRTRPIADITLTADACPGLDALARAVRSRLSREDGSARRGRDARRTALAERHQELRERQADAVRRAWDDRPISPARLVAEVWAAVKEERWLLTLRNTRSWPEGVWQFSGAGQFLGPSGGAGIGYGPGAMVGGALAAYDRGEFPVAIVGDGDLLMSASALWTAAHYRIPLLAVVHNNRSFLNDEAHQRRVAEARGRPVANAGIGTRLEDPEADLAALARSLGARSEGPIEDPDELAPALARAVKQVHAGHLVVVDVRTSSG